jgi:hypothetical protein
MRGNVHVLVLRGARHSNVPGLPDRSGSGGPAIGAGGRSSEDGWIDDPGGSALHR